MIFDNLEEKLDSIIETENKADFVQEFDCIFAESSEWDGNRYEQNLKLINKVSHLATELNFMSFFNGGARYSLELENFYIIYEDNKKRKYENYIHYLFKKDITEDLEVKITFSSLESYIPTITIRDIKGKLLFTYNTKENRLHLKDLEEAPDYYKYVLNHFLDGNINDYLFLNYDFKKPELIIALRNIDKILN